MALGARAIGAPVNALSNYFGIKVANIGYVVSRESQFCPVCPGCLLFVLDG